MCNSVHEYCNSYLRISAGSGRFWDELHRSRRPHDAKRVRERSEFLRMRESDKNNNVHDQTDAYNILRTMPLTSGLPVMTKF